MVSRTHTLVLVLLLAGSGLYGQENPSIFLSLTRKAEFFRDMPTNTSVITSAEIMENDPCNLGEILKNEVGLINGQYGTLGASTNIMLRGSSPEQVLVLIDGRRINDPAMGLVDLGSIPVENIERIEIIRGGASAIYGTTAFGGVVNIITKKPESGPSAAEIGFSGHSFNTKAFRLNFGTKQEKNSGLFTASRTVSDGWRKNSDYDTNNFFARLGFDDKILGQFDFSGSFFRSIAGVPGLGVSLDKYDGKAELEASTPDASQSENRVYSRLEHSKSWNENSLKTVIYASSDNTDYKVPSWTKNDEYKSFVFGSELQFSTTLGTTFGAEWWQEMYKQFDYNANIDKIDRSRSTSALYVQHELKLNKFVLLPSMRFDDNSGFGSVFSPRVTVTYMASNTLKFSANSGKAWRAPTFNELYWPQDSSFFWGTTYLTIGNPTLKPEEGIASDAGVEYTQPNNKTRLTFFLTESENLISWQEKADIPANTVTTSPENIGKSRQQGIEFEFSQKILQGLYHQLNYTYLNAEDTQNSKTLIYRPSNTINYGVSYLFAWNMKLSTNLQYVGSQQTGDTFPPIVSELPEYALWGIKITQKLADAEFWIKIDNVTDKRYQTRHEFPLPGRTFSGGINIRFWS